MIDTFFNLLRKTMYTFVFVVFGLTAAYAPVINVDDNSGTVEVAHAGAGIVFDPTDYPLDIKNAVEGTLRTLDSAWDYLKESVLDGIAWGIAKQLIATLVADLVDWINTGTEGGPAFVQNLGDYLLEQADKVAGEFIDQLGADTSFVCDPFKLDVQIAVAEQIDEVFRSETQPTQRSCVITEEVEDFEAFIEGDFSAGGWDGWLMLISDPEVNTPYGAILNARSELDARILESDTEETQLLDFGNGFISTELCNVFAGPGGDTEECFITTPGKIITEQLNKSLGIGLDQLVAADEFDEIIVTLVAQLANEAVAGASGLLGLSGGNEGSYQRYERGSFVDDLADGFIDGTGTGGNSIIDGEGLVTTNPGINSSRDLIVNSLQTQSQTLTSVDTYIANLNAFINNPLNDETDIAFARVALNDAQSIRSRVATGVSAATPILNQYDALEAEYETATPERRSEIQLQQGDLIQEYNALRLITDQEYGVYSGQWDTLLDRNVGPLIDPCDFSSGEISPECFGDFGDVRF